MRLSLKTTAPTMVVRVFVSQFLPSDRGLVRDEIIEDIEDARAWYRSQAYDSGEFQNLQLPMIEKGDLSWSESSTQTSHAPLHISLSSAPSSSQLPDSSSRPSDLFPRSKLRSTKKPFKALALLTSLAADLDLISDWVFLFHSYRNYKLYRNEYEENPVDGKSPYLFPPSLLWSLIVVCILGTLMWLVLASEGRLITPILRLWGIDKMSLGWALFLGVLVEDIPQVFLTFMIEDYYPENRSVNDFALVNVVTSLYDTLIKLAESFDERADLIETGVWCKQSIWAHNGPVSMVLPLPVPDEDDDDGLNAGIVSVLASPKQPNRKAPKKSVSRMHLPPQPRDVRQSTRQSILDHAVEVVAETKLPRHRFLSASLDKSVRLFDIPPTTSSQKFINNTRDYCERYFKGHTTGVTCLEFLGKKKKANSLGEDSEFFLTGSRDGKARLWNLQTADCVRQYRTFHENGKGAKKIGVTSITSVRKWETFVCGYRDNMARVWDLASGSCLVEYSGHGGPITSVCSLEDSLRFLSASEDSTIRLWRDDKQPIGCTDSSTPLKNKVAMERSVDFTKSKETSSNPVLITSLTSTAGCSREKVSLKTYIGHTGPVLSLACVEPEIAFLSGSQDRTARLWSVESGVCLRVFSGHTRAVTTVATVDQVTFLTGSKDATVKVWDAFTGQSLRTYRGHSGAITSVSVAQDGTFVSSSVDKTIKLWVFTAVAPSLLSGDTLEDILAANDTACNIMLCNNKA